MSKVGCIALACIAAWIALVVLGENGFSVAGGMKSLKSLIKKYQVEGCVLLVLFWVLALWPSDKNHK